MATIEQIQVGEDVYDIAESGYAISNQYSTDEKIVGTWIDGKPVYQKTIILPDRISLNANTWTITNVSIPNIGILCGLGIAIDTLASSGHYITYPVYINIDMSTNNISLLQTRNNAMICRIFTLQYTKTTD